MKWIADINLCYHNVENIKSIWLHKTELRDRNDTSYFQIRLNLIDDDENDYYVVDKLYVDIDKAQDYLEDIMIKSFGKDNLLFRWEYPQNDTT